MAVICFELIPGALEISPNSMAITGVSLGIIAMIYCDLIVQNKFNNQAIKKNGVSSLLKVGIIVSIGLAIHNIPEG